MSSDITETTSYSVPVWSETTGKKPSLSDLTVAMARLESFVNGASLCEVQAIELVPTLDRIDLEVRVVFRPTDY